MKGNFWLNLGSLMLKHKLNSRQMKLKVYKGLKNKVIQGANKFYLESSIC